MSAGMPVSVFYELNRNIPYVVFPDPEQREKITLIEVAIIASENVTPLTYCYMSIGYLSKINSATLTPVVYLNTVPKDTKNRKYGLDYALFTTSPSVYLNWFHTHQIWGSKPFVIRTHDKKMIRNSLNYNPNYTGIGMRGIIAFMIHAGGAIDNGIAAAITATLKLEAE